MNNNTNILFFYDFETNGIKPITCAAMQIAIIDNNGDILKNQYILPYDGIIAASEIHGIDENKLKENNAMNADAFFGELIDWVDTLHPNKNIYWVAYNNFGYDQIVMEAHLRRIDKKVPDNWYFIDMFPFVKEYFQDIKPNYKLKTVYESLVINKEPVQYHCALADSICLYHIYNRFVELGVNDILLQRFGRCALSSNNIFICPITTLGGYMYKLNSFYVKNKITTIGKLYNIYTGYNFMNDPMNYHLKNIFYIKSDFHNKNLIEQLNIINFLQRPSNKRKRYDDAPEKE